MIYTISELQRLVAPVARKYGISCVYLFGSYARNEATESSDVDLLVDRAGSWIRSLYDMGGLYEDLRAGIQKEIDLVTVQALEQESTRRRTPAFAEAVKKERVRIL